MSLRWKWALSLGLVAAVAIGLTAWAAILSAERQLLGGVDASLRERATEVVRRTERRGPGELRHLWEESRNANPGAVLQLFDQGGEVALRIGPEGVDLPVETADLEIVGRAGSSIIREILIGEVAYRVITARFRQPPAESVSAAGFQIAVDVSGINADLAGFTRRMVPIGLIGILLVGITGWVLASRAVRPVIDLTETAEQVAATEQLEAGARLDQTAPGEIGRLAAAFSSMLAALSSSRRQQQRLVSDAGHEFRTPITALRTNLETLRRQDRDLTDEQRRELLEAALTESNLLADLATELVDLATDVRQQDEELAEIELGDLAADVAHRFRRVGGKQLTVTGEGGPVRGRRSQLERALGNLVDNAVKWASGKVEIRLAAGSITVLDDGPGIPDEDLPHIFGRFYRSRQARATPGSGLGLAIVEHLVTAHGGAVFARNRPEGGAEVGFTLPS